MRQLMKPNRSAVFAWSGHRVSSTPSLYVRKMASGAVQRSASVAESFVKDAAQRRYLVHGAFPRIHRLADVAGPHS
jgi:hypothetical protein